MNMSRIYPLTTTDPYVPVRLSFCRFVAPRLSPSALKLYHLMLANCYQRTIVQGQAQWVFVERALSERYIAEATRMAKNSASAAIQELLEWKLIALVSPGTITNAAVYRLRFDVGVEVGEEGEVVMVELPAENPAEGVGQILTLSPGGGSNFDPGGGSNFDPGGGSNFDPGGGSNFDPICKEDQEESKRESNTNARASKNGQEGIAVIADGETVEDMGGPFLPLGASLVRPTTTVPAAPHHTSVNVEVANELPSPDVQDLIAHFRLRTALEPNARGATFAQKWVQPLETLLKGAGSVEAAKGVIDEALGRARGGNRTGTVYTVATPQSLATFTTGVLSERASESKGDEAAKLWRRVMEALNDATQRDPRLLAAVRAIGGTPAITNVRTADLPDLQRRLYDAFLAAPQAAETALGAS